MRYQLFLCDLVFVAERTRHGSWYFCICQQALFQNIVPIILGLPHRLLSMSRLAYLKQKGISLQLSFLDRSVFVLMIPSIDRLANSMTG